MTKPPTASRPLIRVADLSRGPGLCLERKRQTPWTIVVPADPANEPGPYVAIYRSALAEGTLCQQFSLYRKQNNVAVAQMRLFADGRFAFRNFAPAEVELNPRQFRLTVSPVVHANVY